MERPDNSHSSYKHGTDGSAIDATPYDLCSELKYCLHEYDVFQLVLN
jgi:hypothetical protein